MSLQRQQYKNFEVVIAEDDNSPETKNFLKKISANFFFKIVHVFQKSDDGFRKNEMLNKAISVAHGEFIIIIDGDCILHRAFFKEYAKNAEDKTILFGRRALLSESITKKLLASKRLQQLNLLNLILSGSSRVGECYAPNFAESFS